MPRPASRGDVIAVLNRLVRAGVITSFQTQLFDKDRADKPDIAVAIADPERCAEVLRLVRQALQPLGLDLSVVVDLNGIPGDGCS
jgi:hypothetical protein